MKICIVVGTRPEIIKAAPLIRVCENRKLNYFILHTGQHYSHNMDKIFFKELKIPQPKYNLQIGSKSHAEQTGTMLLKIEKILIDEKPSVVLVLGDTNSVLAATLAATKIHIKVGHIESGLRSFDRDMAEEQNRIVVDHLSDYLFAPTENAAVTLANEGMSRNKIFIVGNTIVDAVIGNIKLLDEREDILKKMGLEKEKYIIATAHRPESVDDNIKLSKIMLGLDKVSESTKMPIVFSAHPRTKKRMEEFNLRFRNGITVIEPVGYLDFLQLLQNAQIVITDSGGIQEESSVLKIPCVTMRENTERPETLAIGSNKLAGLDPETIVQKSLEMMAIKRDWISPYGDGKAAEKIINILESQIR